MAFRSEKGSVHLVVFGAVRLLFYGLAREFGRLVSVEFTRGDPLQHRRHDRNGLSIIGKLGLKRLVDCLVYGLNLVFPGTTVGGGVVDGLQAGTGDGNIAFGVRIVFGMAVSFKP